jgi:hypothetical protein
VIVSSSLQTGHVAMTSWTIVSAANGRTRRASLGRGARRPPRREVHDLRTVAMCVSELKIEDARVKHRDWLLPEWQLPALIWI